jgi:hypothetical protein
MARSLSSWEDGPQAGEGREDGELWEDGPQAGGGRNEEGLREDGPQAAPDSQKMRVIEARP